MKLGNFIEANALVVAGIEIVACGIAVLFSRIDKGFGNGPW